MTTNKSKISDKQRLYHLNMAKDLISENVNQFAPIIDFVLMQPPQNREIYFLKYHLFLEHLELALSS